MYSHWHHHQCFSIYDYRLYFYKTWNDWCHIDDTVITIIIIRILVCTLYIFIADIYRLLLLNVQYIYICEWWMNLAIVAHHYMIYIIRWILHHDVCILQGCVVCTRANVRLLLLLAAAWHYENGTWQCDDVYFGLRLPWKTRIALESINIGMRWINVCCCGTHEVRGRERYTYMYNVPHSKSLAYRLLLLGEVCVMPLTLTLSYTIIIHSFIHNNMARTQIMLVVSPKIVYAHCI